MAVHRGGRLSPAEVMGGGGTMVANAVHEGNGAVGS